MLSKILGTATLIVVVWMSVQLLRSQHALETAQETFELSLVSMRAELNEAAEHNEAIGADVLQRMDELSAEQLKIAASANKLAQSSANKVDPKVLKAKDQKITQMTQVASMQNVIVNVFKADQLGKEKQGEKASELMLSTKSSIWKLSGKWGKNKDALRGLMAPIDILASKWKRGDYTGDIKPIQKILQDVLATQTKT